MLKRAYFIAAYLASWVVFGSAAVVLPPLFALYYFLRGPEHARPVVREMIRRFFALWVGWLRVTGLVEIDWQGLDAAALRRPTVCVANHPGLLDAVFILSRLPDAVVIFKRTLLRNPFLAPSAIMSGHPRCDTGPDFVRAAVRQISAGRTLLIFPEGTRTDANAVLNPLKPGFALIAARAGVPVQLIVIRSSRDLLPRGRAWWHVPQFPAKVEIRADWCLPAPAAETRARVTADLVENRLRTCLA